MVADNNMDLYQLLLFLHSFPIGNRPSCWGYSRWNFPVP